MPRSAHVGGSRLLALDRCVLVFGQLFWPDGPVRGSAKRWPCNAGWDDAVEDACVRAVRGAAGAIQGRLQS